MSINSSEPYTNTIEKGSIVTKETFSTIRDDIESAISAGQREVIQSVNNFQNATCKKVSVESQLPKIEEDEEERGHWGSKAEFILSCVGFSVSKIPKYKLEN